MRRPTCSFNAGESPGFSSEPRGFSGRYPEDADGYGQCSTSASESSGTDAGGNACTSDSFGTDMCDVNSGENLFYSSIKDENVMLMPAVLSNVLSASEDHHKPRKRKERQDSTSSITQEKKLVRSNSEERPFEKQKAASGCEIRRVLSHEDFLPLHERNSDKAHVPNNKSQVAFLEVSNQSDRNINENSMNGGFLQKDFRSVSPTRSHLHPYSQNSRATLDCRADYSEEADHEHRRQIERFSRIKSPTASLCKAVDGRKIHRAQRTSRPKPNIPTYQDEVNQTSYSQMQHDEYEAETNENNISQPTPFSWSELCDFRPVPSPHVENLRTGMFNTSENNTDLVDNSSSTSKLKKSDDTLDIIPMTECHARKYELHSKALLDSNSTILYNKDYNDALGLTSTEERLIQICKKLSELKKRITKHEEDFEYQNGYRMSQVEKIANRSINKIYNKIQKLRKEKLRLKIDPSFSITNVGNIKHNLAEIEKRIQEKELQSEEMKGIDLEDEKVELEKALLFIEAQCDRSGASEIKEFSQPMQNRYRQVKRFVLKSQMSKIKSSINELETILENETMDFLPFDTAQPSSISFPQKICEDISNARFSNPDQEMLYPSNHLEKLNSNNIKFLTTIVDGSLPQLLNSRVFNSTATGSIHTNLHNLSLEELRLQLAATYEEKKQLRRSIRDFEHNFEIKTGRRLQKKDKTSMETTYGLYKQIKAKLKLLEALVNKQKPK